MSRSLRLLLVEDSEDDAVLVIRQLRAAGFDLTFERVDTAATMDQALGKQEWDVILCDYNMPGFDAWAALSLTKRKALDVPFIIVSGTIGEDVAVAAMKAGAHDYILKGNLTRLGAAVEREVREAADRARQRKQEEQNNRLLSALSLYVHPEVARKVSEEGHHLCVGGEKRELTVLFADLRGFTAAAENLDPEELVDFINAYLEAMTDIVFEYGGLLDKYMGDGLMALWGAPIPMADHAARACRAAVAMLRRQGELQRLWRAQGLPVLEMGIGINSGVMVVGNLGSPRRFAYSAVGDNVNLASRLEELNKLYGTHILISEHTRAEIGDGFQVREIDFARVKGKQHPVAVFELLGSSEGINRVAPHSEFAEALLSYKRHRWDKAHDLFSELAKVQPDDGPTRLYLDRCRFLLEHPPSWEWDGVYNTEIGHLTGSADNGHAATGPSCLVSQRLQTRSPWQFAGRHGTPQSAQLVGPPPTT